MATSSRYRGLLAVLVIFGIALTSLLSQTATARVGSDCPRSVAEGDDGWEEIRVGFSEGTAVPGIKSYVVAYEASDIIVATDGRSILRSRDAGCSFDEVYRLTPSEADLGYSIGRLAAAPDGSTILAAGTAGPPTAGLTTTPMVLVSRDGGRRWAQITDGLPAAGAITDLEVAPSKPTVGYAVIDVPTEAWSSFASTAGPSFTNQVFVTDDGGLNWRPALELEAKVEQQLTGGSAAYVTDVAVHPAKPEALWVGSTSGLYRSKDEGRSFTPVGTLRERIDQVHLSLDQTSRLRAIASAGTDVLHRGTEGGELSSMTAPGVVGSVTATGSTIALAVNNWERGEVWTLDEGGGTWEEITGVGGIARPPFDRLQSDSAGRVYATSDTSIFRFGGISITPPARGWDDLSLNITPTCPSWQPGEPTAPSVGPRLDPTGSEIHLGPGQSRTVEYVLRIPPKPIDLMLLLDTSESMWPRYQDVGWCWVRGQLTDLVDAIRAKDNPDLRVGLADFRAYPSVATPPDMWQSNYPYALRRP